MPRKKKDMLPPQNIAASSSNPVEPNLQPARKRKESMDRTLKNIYDAGEKAHASKLIETHKKRKHSWTWITLISFAVLAGLSWIGFFLFNPSNNFSDNEVTFSIDAPKHAVAGTHVVFTLTYSNNLSIPLATANLFVKYPDDFEYTKAEPDPIDKDRREWSMGMLGAKTKRSITIEGVLWGNKDESTTLRGFFNYRPLNFNADFQKVAAADIQFAQSPLELTLTGSESAHIGDTLTYTITIKNPSNTPFENGLVAIAYPQGFVLQSATPAPNKDQNTWVLNTVAPNSTQTITFKGNFSGTANKEDKTFTLTQLVARNDKKYTGQTIALSTKLEAATYVLEFAVGSAKDQQSIAQGEKLPFTITYKNTSNTALENVSVRATIDGVSDGGKSLFNWAVIDDKLDGAIRGEQVSSTMRRGTITWTKKELPALSALKPGDGGTISFTIPVKDKTSFDMSKIKNTQSAAYVELVGGDTQNTILMKSNTVLLNLMTNLTLAAEAQLKEKKPTAEDGDESYYTVTWTIENSVHEVSDVHIAALLTEGTRWVDKTHVTAGALAFDADAKQVQWKINRIPASFPKTIVSFDVAVKTPKENSGTLKLLDKTRLEAYDKSAGASVMIEKDALTATP
ncbi:MAG: DUF11 domain-containing protein [Candidatus Magasanikbacteria bacterium]|nr:DUF11 domain-containing protein [Candidatus Magasanikbacteria bacterium]